MTTITIDRELLEQALAALTYKGTMGPTRRQRRAAAVDALRAALAAPATAPDDRVKELEAELAATEIAIAEYRQQCLDNAAEIARLRSESEERLQNCAALVAENERLRAALATTPAQPATEPEQLKTGECWPERIMKQWDAMRDLIATGDKTSLPRDWFESLAEMRLIEAPATAPAQPERKPMEDGEKIYKLWHSSDANDLDDFLDGWRHAESFHGITKLAPTGSELPSKQADQMEVTSQGQIPAWHDAPTVPGDWVIVGKGFKSELQTSITQQEIDRVSSWPGRWYGPIPEDKQ